MCILESQVFTVEESRLLPNIRAVVITCNDSIVNVHWHVAPTVHTSNQGFYPCFGG